MDLTVEPKAGRDECAVHHWPQVQAKVIDQGCQAIGPHLVAGVQESLHVRVEPWCSGAAARQARKSKIIAPASRSPRIAKIGSMRTPIDSLSEL